MISMCVPLCGQEEQGNGMQSVSRRQGSCNVNPHDVDRRCQFTCIKVDVCGKKRGAEGLAMSMAERPFVLGRRHLGAAYAFTAIYSLD